MADGTAHLTMEQLLDLREKIGSKAFSESVTKPKMRRIRQKSDTTENSERATPNSQIELQKRPLEKHAPEEISSKIRPKKLRKVVPDLKGVGTTDPRYMPDVTEFNQTAFDKRYSFIGDMEQREKIELTKRLRKAKDKARKKDIHTLINRIDQKANSRKERIEIREREEKWKKEERAKQELGKAPFFQKQGTMAKVYRAEAEDTRISSMNAAQLAKSEAKKDRKMAQKEKKTLPERRE